MIACVIHRVCFQSLVADYDGGDSSESDEEERDGSEEEPASKKARTE